MNEKLTPNLLYAALVKLIKRHVPFRVIPMDVTKVDKENDTISAKEIDGPELQNIRLKSIEGDGGVGIVIYPKVGSSVLVDKIMNDDQNLYVTKVSELESLKIEIKNAFKCELKPDGELLFNGGELKGLPVHDKVQQNLDALKTYADALENAAGLIASALDGLVPGTSVAYNAVTEPAKAACEFVNMENTKIKQ